MKKIKIRWFLLFLLGIIIVLIGVQYGYQPIVIAGLFVGMIFFVLLINSLAKTNAHLVANFIYKDICLAFSEKDPKYVLNIDKKNKIVGDWSGKKDFDIDCLVTLPQKEELIDYARQILTKEKTLVILLSNGRYLNFSLKTRNRK